MKRLIKSLSRIAWLPDLFLSPVIFVAVVWLRLGKFWKLNHVPFTKKILFKIGVLPIVDHYYEPLYDYRNLKEGYEDPRELKGIEFNEIEQLSRLETLHYEEELMKLPYEKTDDLQYYLNNGSYGGSDAALLYVMIREQKPRRIIEIGSGCSTLLMLKAIEKNKEIDAQYHCEVHCVEPYEAPWLNKVNVSVIRDKVEDIKLKFFQQLESGDILFIDSSHVIRPQGDVLCEISHILPVLNKGVYIHFHDIFTPYNYPMSWLKDEFRLWNEQYMLEAFLSYNDSFHTVFSLNYLIKNHFALVKSKFPIVKQASGSAYWIQKIK